MKKLLIRIAIVAVLIIMGFVLFTLGKEHKVFIDNKDLTVNGTTYTATSQYEVWVDGEKVGRLPLRPGRRQVAYVAGPRHSIILQEIKDKEPVGDIIEKKFKLATGDREVVINIPALVKGSKDWLKVVDDE